MSAPVQAQSLVRATDLPAPLRRFALAWGVMVGGLVGFWCLRPWLSTSAFNVGQFVVLGATWKIASLLCLPTRAWGRFTPPRFLAYCVFIGMQPRQFLIGQRTAANAPIPTLAGIIGNACIGAALLWLVPRVLPAGTPWTFRFWIAIAGFIPVACAGCSEAASGWHVPGRSP